MLASSDLLRSGLLCSVYHGQTGVPTLKELARSYLTVTKDLSQVMNRLKAVYRSWAIPCAGKLVYTPRHRAEWLQKLPAARESIRSRISARRAYIPSTSRMRNTAQRFLAGGQVAFVSSIEWRSRCYGAIVAA
jgi:hypothetical protein